MSVCTAAIAAAETEHLDASTSGMVDLLLKAAAHPSVNVCGIALEALSKLAALDENFTLRLLPILQHRAIVPHVLDSGNPSLAASEVCGVDIFEFECFRSTILSDALVSCYRKNQDYYMNSCSVAVEEFCKAAPTVKTSFQLEAALYCLSAVAEESIAAGQALLTKSFVDENATSDMSNKNKNQLARCTQLLETKPVCMTANPLTLSQSCQFIGKVRGTRLPMLFLLVGLRLTYAVPLYCCSTSSGMYRTEMKWLWISQQSCVYLRWQPRWC